MCVSVCEQSVSMYVSVYESEYVYVCVHELVCVSVCAHARGVVAAGVSRAPTLKAPPEQVPTAVRGAALGLARGFSDYRPYGGCLFTRMEKFW